jgi:capsular polysaccharide transport system permease protein
LSGASTNNDTELLKTFIESMDMIQYLQTSLDLKAHYSSNEIDVFSRLSSNATNEELLEYFTQRLNIEIDELSGVLELRVQGFSPDFSQELAKHIVERAEWYINKISNNLAQAQLLFVKGEHQKVEQKLQKAKTKILDFQREYNLLDPEAEGSALQQITYKLESEIASKKAQLRTLMSGMSETAPAVVQLKEELSSIQKQIAIERERLTNNHSSTSDKQGVGEILAQYSNYKIDLEFALQAYSASQVSLEKSRIEAYRQIKYLVLVESPILPQDAKYPEVQYNLTLALVLLLMLFGIGKVVTATVNELR